MEEKKNKIVYILIASSISLLLIYFGLTFLGVIKYKNSNINIYQAALGLTGLNSSPALLTSIILSSISLILIISILILSFFRRTKAICLMLDAIALPLLASSLVINLFMSPIFKQNNFPVKNDISIMFYILVPQNICLAFSILINISTIFYLAIKGYKKYDFERKKEIRHE